MIRRSAALATAAAALVVLFEACTGGDAGPSEQATQAPSGITPASGSAAPSTSTGAATTGAPPKSTPTGGSAPKTGTRPAVFDDPCSVLTLPEVQVAVPGAQPGRNLGTGPNNGSCRWLGSSPVEPQVTFNFEWVEGAAAPLKASFESTLKASGGRRVDVGDGASIRGDDRGFEVRFIKGEFNASLTASPRGQLTEEAIIALGKQAVARLSP